MPYQTGTIHGVMRTALANLILEEVLGLDPGSAAQVRYFYIIYCQDPHQARRHSWGNVRWPMQYKHPFKDCGNIDCFLL